MSTGILGKVGFIILFGNFKKDFTILIVRICLTFKASVTIYLCWGKC